ncbi:MAG: helix-turn-helix transcriptional regulator [Anaerolineae bacterium]|nr:helix-turn-helix transcriptional regulator [Anaerolineae bacterium]
MNNEKQRYRELADFLKTRRAKILPSQVGLSSTARRRTPGLRREEVAQLAGIGLTWYTWLEQGRHIHVSSQVIESLSRVLLLDKQERNHLYRLANQPLPGDLPVYQGAVSPLLQHVLDSLDLCPSFYADQRWNVVAWNKAACTIFGDFTTMNARQRNVVWAMFTDDYFKDLYVDWTSHAKSLLGRFRLTCGKYVEDAWLNTFIEDLKIQSREFTLWWSLHEIQNDGSVFKQLTHPQVGLLEFESSSFDVPDGSGLKLFVHVPLPGTDSAEKMNRLVNV